jgi:type III secretory pathway component EscT
MVTLPVVATATADKRKVRMAATDARRIGFMMMTLLGDRFLLILARSADQSQGKR